MSCTVSTVKELSSRLQPDVTVEDSVGILEESSSPRTSSGLNYYNEPPGTLFLPPSSEVLQIAFTNVSIF